MSTPAAIAAEGERRQTARAGESDHFDGYGIMGLPFRSGHVLALRRFPVSAIGPAYTAIWHRGPDGRWTFWQDQPPEHGCALYFAADGARTRHVPIDLTWTSPTSLRVADASEDLVWTASLRASVRTSTLSAIAGHLPDRAWRSPPVLRALGAVAGVALRAGRLGLDGSAPNGQQFVANPQRLWLVDQTTATLGGQDLGAPGPLESQAVLGDFWIPQRGVFAFGRASFTP